MQVSPNHIPPFRWNDENQHKHIFTISNASNRESVSHRGQHGSVSTLFYKIKTTAPKHFSVQPSEGYIEPGRSVEIVISMKAAMGPDDSQPRFQIRGVRCASTQERPPDLWSQESWAAIESRGIAYRFVIECAKAASASTNAAPDAGAGRSNSLQDRMADWRLKQDDSGKGRAEAPREVFNTTAPKRIPGLDENANPAEKDLARLRNEFLDISGKFENQKEKIVKLEVAMTMLEEENAALQTTLHDQREVIVLHETQNTELMQQYRQQQQKLTSSEEALKLERMTAAAMPERNRQLEIERSARLGHSVMAASRTLEDIKVHQAETRAIASVCLQALREDIVTFSQVVAQQYEFAYRGGNELASFPRVASPAKRAIVTTEEEEEEKQQRSIELWCCVVPNDSNCSAEGPGSVRVRDDSSVEIDVGDETLPFEFDFVTGLSKEITGNVDASFRRWQVILNHQLRGAGGCATMLSFGGANASKTALLEGPGRGAMNLGAGIMSKTMRHLSHLYQGQVEITVSCIEVFENEARDLLNADEAAPTGTIHMDRSHQITIEYDAHGHPFYSNVIGVRLHGPENFDRVYGIVSGRRRMNVVRQGEATELPKYHTAAHKITLLTIHNSPDPSIAPAKIYFVDVAAIDNFQTRESNRDIQALEGILSGSGGRPTKLIELLGDAIRTDATLVSCYSVPDKSRRVGDGLDILISASTITNGGHAPTLSVNNFLSHGGEATGIQDQPRIESAQGRSKAEKKAQANKPWK